MKSITRPRPALAAVTTIILLIATGSLAAVGDHLWSQGFPTGGDIAVDGANNIVMHGAGMIDPLAALRAKPPSMAAASAGRSGGKGSAPKVLKIS